MSLRAQQGNRILNRIHLTSAIASSNYYTIAEGTGGTEDRGLTVFILYLLLYSFILLNYGESIPSQFCSNTVYNDNKLYSILLR